MAHQWAFNLDDAADALAEPAVPVAPDQAAVVSTEPANALAEKDTPMSVQPVKRGRKAADASAAPPSGPDVPAATDQAGDASTSTEPATAGTPMPVEPVKRGRKAADASAAPSSEPAVRVATDQFSDIFYGT